MESWAIIVIVAIVMTTLGNMYRVTLKHRSEGGQRGSELAELKQRLDAIEAQLGSRGVSDRLNALEAIVTDSRYELDREIKRLTDTQPRP